VPDAYAPRVAASYDDVTARIHPEAACPGPFQDCGGPLHRPALHEPRWVEPPRGVDVEEAARRPTVFLAALEHFADVGIGGLGRQRPPIDT
jgi:hypothetical protein